MSQAHRVTTDSMLHTTKGDLQRTSPLRPGHGDVTMVTIVQNGDIYIVPYMSPFFETDHIN